LSVREGILLADGFIARSDAVALTGLASEWDDGAGVVVGDVHSTLRHAQKWKSRSYGASGGHLRTGSRRVDKSRPLRVSQSIFNNLPLHRIVLTKLSHLAVGLIVVWRRCGTENLSWTWKLLPRKRCFKPLQQEETQRQGAFFTSLLRLVGTATVIRKSLYHTSRRG
jgi:hypothetical protein